MLIKSVYIIFQLIRMTSFFSQGGFFFSPFFLYLSSISWTDCNPDLNFNNNENLSHIL